MTPEYLYELAQRADPLELWRADYLSLVGEDKLTVDTGVALRRYAAHLSSLERALKEKRSFLITPIRSGWTASRMVDTPADHEELRNGRE